MTAGGDIRRPPAATFTWRLTSGPGGRPGAIRPCWRGAQAARLVRAQVERDARAPIAARGSTTPRVIRQNANGYPPTNARYGLPVPRWSPLGSVQPGQG